VVFGLLGERREAGKSNRADSVKLTGLALSERINEAVASMGLGKTMACEAEIPRGTLGPLDKYQTPSLSVPVQSANDLELEVWFKGQQDRLRRT
jgi:hypothetical protein